MSYTTLQNQSFTAELQAVIDFADANGIVKPNTLTLWKIDLFIRNLKSAGLYSRMKTGNLYGFGSLQFGTINIKNPSTYRHTVVGAPVFTEGKGIKATAAGNYVNTKYKVNEYAGIENDLTTAVYVSDNNTTASASRLYGSLIIPTPTSTRYQVNARITAGGFTGSVFSYHNNQNTFQSTNARGLYVAVQDNGKSIIYKDGVKTSTTVTTVAPTLSNDVLLLTSNISTTGGVTPEGSFFPNNVMAFFRFNKFTDADEEAFRTIFKNFTHSISSQNTWYVRPAGTTYGTGDGTSYENAFSGNAGINWANIGLWDTVYICGTHNERIDIKASYLIIRGDLPTAPGVLNGLGVINTGLYLEGRRYLNIHGMTIINSLVEGAFAANTCNEINYYDCDVSYVQNQAYQNEENSIIRYYRCRGHHCADDGMSLHSNSTVYAYDCEFYNNVQGVNGIATTKFFGYNCHFHDNSEINIGPQADADFTCVNCLFENGAIKGDSTIPMNLIGCTFINSPVTGYVTIS